MHNHELQTRGSRGWLEALEGTEATTATTDATVDATTDATSNSNNIVDKSTTFDKDVRTTKGADGSTSEHLIEKDANGNTISKTHQVTDPDGNVIQQHQSHIPQNLPPGVKGVPRQFPNEWIQFPDIGL